MCIHETHHHHQSYIWISFYWCTIAFFQQCHAKLLSKNLRLADLPWFCRKARVHYERTELEQVLSYWEKWLWNAVVSYVYVCMPVRFMNIKLFFSTLVQLYLVCLNRCYCCSCWKNYRIEWVTEWMRGWVVRYLFSFFFTLYQNIISNVYFCTWPRLKITPSQKFT